MQTTANTNIQPLLKLTYGLVPIVAGLDKFTNILTHWEKYLSPSLRGILPLEPAMFMHIVGIIEVVAGVLVFWRARPGGYLVMAWLVCIALNLIMAGYYDIAVRDLVMAVGAYSLARISQAAAEQHPHFRMAHS